LGSQKSPLLWVTTYKLGFTDISGFFSAAWGRVFTNVGGTLQAGVYKHFRLLLPYMKKGVY
jgi:hypothetical protein